MRRSWLVWTAFAICLAVVLSAMGWISFQVLRLDRAEAAARTQAALEENVRLALWRMDSMLAPLLARESARPYFAYRTLVPMDLANGRIFNRNEEAAESPGGKGKRPWLFMDGEDWGDLPAEMLVPSPLLAEDNPSVLVHFQFEPDGQLTSPQVPTRGNWKLAVPEHVSEAVAGRAAVRLEKVAALADREDLMEALPASTPGPVAVVLSRRALPPPQAEQPDYQPAQAAPHAEPQSEQQQGLGLRQFLSQGRYGQYAGPQQQERRSQVEFEQRNRAVQQQANTMVQNFGLNQFNAANDLSWAATDLSGVLMTPLWVEGHLLLARRVTAGGREYVQGCLLDWPGVRKELLGSIADLLPEARLEPIAGPLPADAGARMLAALPLRLVPGGEFDGAAAPVSPIRLSLAVAWGCVLLAAGAVGVLLWGVLRLSERRAAFVSAVTHELRTPLTTFRMYAEMLADGMVPPDGQKSYLETLQREASRLTHMVENVLAYARLERGRPNGQAEEVTVARLVETVEGRLADHARQADMQLLVDCDETAAQCLVQANLSAVEQILFNLVDNACKYAGEADDRRIHLEVGRTDSRAWLRVRDHGPGIAPAAARRLFHSFSKSAHDAANSAPGVGLGLALSHRLARDMGGRLSLDGNLTEGAALTLTLPVAA